jgi:hypothetical protein
MYDLEIFIYDDASEEYFPLDIMIDSYDEGQPAILGRAPEDCCEAIPPEVEFTAYLDDVVFVIPEDLQSQAEEKVLEAIQ